MPHTVTVGLDGSRASHAALDWAASEALRRSATLEIVQVHETGAYPYSQLLDDQAEVDRAERLGAEAVRALRERRPNLHVTSRIVAGRPAHVLDEIAADSDLLVLGSRGLGGVRGFLVGSAALPAVSHARSPVVLVRAAGEGESAEREGDVVVGVRPDAAPPVVLDFAFDAAARRAVALRVVYGVDVPATHRFGRRREAPQPDARFVEERTQALRDVVEPWQERFPGVRVHCGTVVGPPADLLLDEADDAALLVVGRRPPPRRMGTHIGPLTHAVMHHSVVPVAVVPHP